MSKDYRKTSKLAIAGLIFAVAAPCLAVLCIFFSVNGISGFDDALALSVPAMPFIALLLSIAGVVVSKKNDMKGLIPGFVGLILSIVEILFLIISISSFLTRMQHFNPFV